jgi:methylated-DNA-[protein]-cysteine S-methyltransferase
MTASATAATHVAIASPIGPLTLAAADGRLTGLYMDAHRHPPSAARLGAPGDPAAAPFAAAAAQLGSYFAGKLTSFDLPVQLLGTPFQLMVWGQLSGIGYGQTASYGELAERLGRPLASRAVGLANGKNPVSIIIPCHRVLGADGGLTGYGGGLDRKRYLLDLERRGAPPAAPAGA